MKRENKPAHAGVTRMQFIVLTLVALLSLPVSCTNDDSALPPMGNAGEPVAVEIIPSGIALYGSVTESGSTRSVSGKKERVHFLEDFDEKNMLETIIEETPEEVAVPTRAVKLTNTTMRVVACNSAGDIVSQCAYNVTNGVATPQPGQLLVVKNSASPYTFHCYSPANAINTSTKKVTVNIGDNFAYNKVTQVINSSSLAATVTIPALTPMMSKVKFSVSSTEISGTITCTGTVKGTFGTGGTWTLGGGSLTGMTTANQTISFSANNAEVAVPPTGATGNLTLTIANLKIGSASKSAPTLSTASGFTLQAGKMYTVSIGIKKKNYVVNTNLHLRVASGNLMYTGGKWHLAPDQGWYSGNAKGGDYFSWGLTDPLKFGQEVWGSDMNALSDVCVQLLGNGWRIPIKDDLERLRTVTNRVVSTYASSRGSTKGMYWGTTDAARASASQDSYVFLPFGGYRSGITGKWTPTGTAYYWFQGWGPDISIPYMVIIDERGSFRELHTMDFAHYGYLLRCVADE